MTYYSKTGNKAMVKRIFKKYKAHIEKELDCSLSEETENLYHDLTS
jgi:hypothetical protein